MRTILVGVDGSPSSLRALQFAADLAIDLGAELVVVFARHVYLAMPEHSAEDMFSDVLDRAEHAILEAIAGELGGRDLRWRYETQVGPPADVLCEIAERTGASFLVVGRHGGSSLRELVLGSVSNRLAHRSDRPVLLVP